MAVAWSVIDGIVHGPDLLLADGGEAGALGETLTNQPVGVPIAAAPPWMTGQGEAEHRAGGLYDLLEVSELHTPVQGHGPAPPDAFGARRSPHRQRRVWHARRSVLRRADRFCGPRA